MRGEGVVLPGGDGSGVDPGRDLLVGAPRGTASSEPGALEPMPATSIRSRSSSITDWGTALS
jgi:hypothetical protein